MNGIVDLLREDLRDFGGYRSARSEAAEGSIWLNANESPWTSAGDANARLRRYPEPQPQALRDALAALYGCTPDQLLIGRGSDEAIDLLVRAFCTPGRDAVLVTPPVFGMYAVCARLQGARLLEVPLRDGADDFHVDMDKVAHVALEQGAKLVFLCSPGNPAGAPLPGEAVLGLAKLLSGRAIVIVDEAYVEFSDTRSLAGAVGACGNLAVLRTLSKAHALAAARVGCLIAAADTIAIVRRCQAPYPVPVPSAEQALLALKPRSLLHTHAGIVAVRRERERLHAALADAPGVRRVYPSQGNFLLARFFDTQAAYLKLLEHDIVVRDVRAFPQLGDALRITIGTREQNAVVVSTLNDMGGRSVVGGQR